MKVKFLWNGVKIDGKLFRAAYSKGPYTPESKLPPETITIYRKDYGPMPKVSGLTVTNNTDVISDYHETDTIRIKPGQPYYFEALTAYNQREKHFEQRFAKRKAI